MSLQPLQAVVLSLSQAISKFLYTGFGTYSPPRWGRKSQYFPGARITALPNSWFKYLSFCFRNQSCPILFQIEESKLNTQQSRRDIFMLALWRIQSSLRYCTSYSPGSGPVELETLFISILTGFLSVMVSLLLSMKIARPFVFLIPRTFGRNEVVGCWRTALLFFLPLHSPLLLLAPWSGNLSL